MGERDAGAIIDGIRLSEELMSGNSDSIQVQISRSIELQYVPR